MPSAIWAFCSTRRNVVPRSWLIFWMIAKISRTSSGARPSQRSSTPSTTRLAPRRPAAFPHRPPPNPHHLLPPAQQGAGRLLPPLDQPREGLVDHLHVAAD